MNFLIGSHEPLPDCDCGDCAKYERDRLRVALTSAKKDALEDAANKFDGTTGYNWMAADGYANAFDIACELRYMATEVPNLTMDKATVIKLAEEAGFIYHAGYTHASFAPGGRSTKPEGFKYSLKEIPFETMHKLLSSAFKVNT